MTTSNRSLTTPQVALQMSCRPSSRASVQPLQRQRKITHTRALSRAIRILHFPPSLPHSLSLILDYSRSIFSGPSVTRQPKWIFSSAFDAHLSCFYRLINLAFVFARRKRYEIYSSPPHNVSLKRE